MEGVAIVIVAFWMMIGAFFVSIGLFVYFSHKKKDKQAIIFGMLSAVLLFLFVLMVIALF